MGFRLVLPASAVALFTTLVITQPQPRRRLNPVIDLLEQKKPVFGLYAPGSGRRPGDAPALEPIE